MEDLVKTLEVYYMPETQTFSAHLAIHINAHNIAASHRQRRTFQRKRQSRQISW